MSEYIYQYNAWPKFTWNIKALAKSLEAAHYHQDMLLKHMNNIGFQLRDEATLLSLTEEVVKSSEIEGEIIDKDQVRSSIARHLGVYIGALTPSERYVEGVVEMMLDATQKFVNPLTHERLFNWHGALFPTGRSGINAITVGDWRKPYKDPMQVISGPIGREYIHFQAPPAAKVNALMRDFLHWFNSYDGTDLILRAGIAHLWFVTIHPFEDGNGRIARAITDMALARSEKSSQRFYSMSAQIRRERTSYYDILEKTQKGDLDITAWLEWFLICLVMAFKRANTTLEAVLFKARFWEAYKAFAFNPRQKLVLNLLLDNFEGKLTSSKWGKLAKCSQDTASRDIENLVSNGILKKDSAGGRSTSYSLVFAKSRFG